jgi:protein-L-isoaspartate(D-aspartate) O-methyltransferase
VVRRPRPGLRPARRRPRPEPARDRPPRRRGDRPHPTWRQVNLWCDTWRDTEHLAATHLFPLLTDAEDTGALAAWWFVRKRESWRLRLLPADGGEELSQLAQRLTDHPAVRDHAADVVYEPETRRFGGPEAMQTAHRLFCADSRHILAHLAAADGGPDQRRETGVRLACRLMHAAAQDFYEQGDVWAAVNEHRATAHTPEPTAGTIAAVQTLLTAEGDTADSPLTRNPGWPECFEQAGRHLADLAHHGRLSRGLRAVLTDHLLFTFNRLGIPAEQQAVLAGAARRVVFHRQNNPDKRTTVRTVTMNPPTTTAQVQQLRDDLIAKLDRMGLFHTDAVKDAFRTVPRHLFLPEADVAEAYAKKPVVTKRAADGTAISSASNPTVVTIMLEQLQAQPGQSVQEIGAATGINAALLAEIVGTTGKIVTLELDEDLTDGARDHLTETGYADRVTVICRDGALGAEEHAPFDRLIVTAGAWDVPAAWWQQLAVGGRMVVPLRLHGSGLTRSIAFERTGENRMVSTNSEVCGFVPMRGAAEMGEQHVRLADEIILKVDVDDLPDETALADALAHPAKQHWTGIEVRHDEPAAHLDLWLATTSGLSFGKLSVSKEARELGLADPALRWSGATLYDGGTLSYLAVRPIGEDTDELGIVTHGPDADKFTGQVGDLLHQWSGIRPAQPIITAWLATAPDDQAPAAALVVRPDTRLTISW